MDKIMWITQSTLNFGGPCPSTDLKIGLENSFILIPGVLLCLTSLRVPEIETIAARQAIKTRDETTRFIFSNRMIYNSIGIPSVSNIKYPLIDRE
jgi:hypothetical protein